MTEVHRTRLFDYVPSPIVSISLHKNSLVVARDSGYIEIWSIEGLMHCMASFHAAESEDIRCVAWCKRRDKTAIAFATLSGALTIYEYPGLKLSETSSSFGGPIWNMAVHPSQTVIALACDDGAVRIFDISSDIQLSVVSDLFPSRCLSVCFANDGSLFAGDFSGHIQQIDQSTGRFVQSLKHPKISSSEVSITALTALDNGQIASGDTNGTVLIWDPQTATVADQFHVHQSDILCLASKGDSLYASGVDPTIAGFQYSEHRWTHFMHLHTHTHDVTSIAIGNESIFTAGKDSSIMSRNLLALPFQKKPSISHANREGAIVIAGAEGQQLSVWKLADQKANLEMKLKAEESVEVVALGPKANSLAYSASATKVLTFDGSQWQFTDKVLPRATAITYDSNETLYHGTIEGVLTVDKKSVNVGFPIFRICVSHNSKFIAVGGIKRIVILNSDLAVHCEIPKMETPFSCFEFQPGKNRLFISTGEHKMVVYNVHKKEFVTKLTINLGKFKGAVAVNTICFDPENPDRILFASSQVAAVINLKKREAGKTRLPYNDILYVGFAANNRIIIFEKPWSFMMQSLPQPFRTKRFVGFGEENRPRY